MSAAMRAMGGAGLRAGPVRAGALGACYLYRAAMALLAAAPLSLAFGSVIGRHPRGDAVLWEDGGMWLAESLRLLLPTLGSAVGLGGVIALLAAFGWLLPLGALVVSLAPDKPPARACLGRAGERLGSLSLMMGVTLVLQAAVLALAVVLGRVVGEGDSRNALLLRLAAALVGLLGCWLIAVVHDLARVACLHRGFGLWGSVREGWAMLVARPGALLWASSWRAAAALGVLATALAVGVMWTQPGRGDLLPMVLLHQLALLSYVWLRASWLRKATSHALAR